MRALAFVFFLLLALPAPIWGACSSTFLGLSQNRPR